MEPIDAIEHRDTTGRAYYSTLLHWLHPRGPAHCLMQAVFLPENQVKVFLAALMTCPRSRGIFYDPELAANAAWTLLEGQFGKLSHFDIEWLFRFGDFSTYDSGEPAGVARFNFTRDEQGRWRYREYDHVLLKPAEEQRIIRVTNVAVVEDDLAKLPKMPHPEPFDR